MFGGFAAAGKVPSRKLQRAYVLFIVILDLMVGGAYRNRNFATPAPLTFLALDLCATGHCIEFSQSALPMRCSFTRLLTIGFCSDRLLLQRLFDVPTGLAD